MKTNRLKNETEACGECGKTARKGKPPFRLLDFVIIAAVVLISLAPLLFLPKDEGSTVVITWHGEEIYRGSITKDQTVVTPDGLNTIVIENGSVRMENAECRDRICVRSGAASPSHPIVCLPNRVVVTVIGTEEVDSGTW